MIVQVDQLAGEQKITRQRDRVRRVDDCDCISPLLSRLSVAPTPWRRGLPVLQNVFRGSVSLRWSARSCSIASAPSSDQNFSVPLTRRLNILTVDSIWLDVIGNPALRYSS